MSKEIKTKSPFKDIKVLDKTTSATSHAKNAFIRSKQSAEATQEPQHHPASEYASDHVESGARDVADKAVNRLKNPQNKIKQNVNNAKDRFQYAKRNTPKQREQVAEQAKKTADNAKQIADTLKGKAEQAKKTAEQAKKAATNAKETLQRTRATGRQTVQTAKKTAPKGNQAESAVQTSAKTAKATGKGTVKTVKKSVKTTEKSAKATVKTAERAAKTAQHTAKATAKAAQLSAKASRETARFAAKTTKAATKATVVTVKAAVAAVKGTVSLIAAGGWVAVVVIIIICLIGLLLGSSFGIFFSSEDSGTGRFMPAVVQELQAEFYSRTERIKNNNAHDVLIEDAMSINWPEVLAVYAVRVNTDPNNPAEVATLDDDKVNRLRDVLNDMVSLSHSTKTETYEQTVTTTDADGNEIETSETVSITTLIIVLFQKSADDVATRYRFKQTQKDQMHELLSSEYNNLWTALLGGYSAGNGEIGTPDSSRVPNDIFSWPMGEGFSISSTFGYRRDPFTGETKYHGGLDIRAAEGTPILAAADGIVTVANSTDSWGGGYGYYVKIQHTDTYATLYAHCSRITVVKGQEVKKGEVIAFVGSTGRSTGAHLHFEVSKDGVRTNPLNYFQ